MPNALYKVTPGQTQPPLASDINQLIDLLNGLVDAGVLTLAAPISAPSNAGITATAATGTALGVGAYRYQLTYASGVKKSDGTIVLGGETLPSAAVTVTTTTGNQAVNLGALPTVWPTTAVALRIYRTPLGGADGTQKLVATIFIPVASYADTTADGALGAAVPTTNTTGTTIQNYVDQSSNQTITGAKTFSVITKIGNLSLAALAMAFNRDNTTGAIYDNTKPAYQIFMNANRLDVQAYNSAGTLLGTPIIINGIVVSTGNNMLDDGTGIAKFVGAVGFADDGTAQNASIHIKQALGGFGRLTQMSPKGASQPALNLIANTDAASATNWWAWGLDASGVYRINSGTGLGGAGLSIDASGNGTIGGSLTVNGAGGSFANSKNLNGYQKLPGGLILQWGNNVALINGSFSDYTLPIAFPNGNLWASASLNAAVQAHVMATGISTNTVRLWAMAPTATGNVSINWLVIGW